MQVLKFNNPGVIIDRLPPQLFLHLKEVLQENRKNKQTFDTQAKRNAQVISIKEIDHVPYIKELDDYLKQFHFKWCELFDVLPQSIKVDSVWVNYMRKTEFAPIHAHNASFAFVIWVKIPYNSEDENKYHSSHIDSTSSIEQINLNGKFSFMYQRYTGETSFYSIPLNEQYEGTIVMFPANMNHIAYPFFSSDEERISVAGNLICVQ